MKNLLFLIISLSLFANELQWVDEQIEAIKPSRSGIDKKSIEDLQDPFIFLLKTKEEKLNKTASSTSKNNIAPIRSVSSTNNTITKKETSFSLDAIINNSALINGKWYNLNSKVGSYTLTNVDKTSVVLSYKSKELLLTTQSKSKNIKFKNN